MIQTIALQAGGVASKIPLPSSGMIAVVTLALLAGMSVPTAYGIERLQGFGSVGTPDKLALRARYNDGIDHAELHEYQPEYEQKLYIA